MSIPVLVLFQQKQDQMITRILRRSSPRAGPELVDVVTQETPNKSYEEGGAVPSAWPYVIRGYHLGRTHEHGPGSRRIQGFALCLADLLSKFHHVSHDTVSTSYAGAHICRPHYTITVSNTHTRCTP